MPDWNYSGSYSPLDAIFLMRPVEFAETTIETKEKLIQSGLRHYSEMITREKAPPLSYLRLFELAMKNNARRFSHDLLLLSDEILRATTDSITLVSLARAGTPIGALLTRRLRRTRPDVKHFSISIIRDRGIDTCALQYILERRHHESIIFIDGWTGKGVMCRELRKSLNEARIRENLPYKGELLVISDLCGEAGFSATDDDYLIPSSLLGATISGLVSRSIRNSDVVRAGEFDACIEYSEFKAIDNSQTFVNAIDQLMISEESGLHTVPNSPSKAVKNTRQQQLRFSAIKALMNEFHVSSENYIKPGICESTRVLLRRVPHVVLLRDAEIAAVQHLISLARERNTEIVIRHDLPWEAVALIAQT